MSWYDFMQHLRRPGRRAGMAEAPQGGLGAAPAYARGTPDSGAAPFPSTGPHGHRQRMREKLLTRGAEALADYELLEMLLFLAQPKGDTKPLAKRLINAFGSLAGVVTAAPEKLLAQAGIGEHSAAAIKLAQAVGLRMARAEAVAAPVMGSYDSLLAYLTAAMGHEKVEQFRVLFLDTRNRVLADEVLGKGTVNHTPVYPREIVRRALDLHATALVLAHNHPSGDPTPSRDDVEMTREVARAAEALGIVLHDHIVVGKERWVSFRREGLM